MEIQNKIKILILDDEKQFTEELGGFFVGSNYEAFDANTAEEGKKILNNNEIDILILDVRLPGVNGLDILKEVKIQYPGMEVIIISAHGDMDTVIKAMRLGAFDYLRKPFRYIDMQVTIDAVRRDPDRLVALFSIAVKDSIGKQLLDHKLNP